MNFEDPFANDLRSFDATANALRRGAGRGSPESRPFAAATSSLPVGGGIIDFDIGGPTGGRRRRAGEAAAPLATQAASSRQPPAQQVQWERQEQQQHLQGGEGQLARSGRRQGGGPIASSVPSHAPPPSHADALVLDEDDPLAFLERNVSGAVPSRTAPAPQGGPPPPAVSKAVVTPEAAAAQAAQAKQAEEMRDLNAQLYALEEELTKAEDKLHLQETKEEAELLTLATTTIEKQLELERQESQLKEECAKVRRSSEARIAATRQRYAEELSEQETEVRRLEADRFSRHMKQLHTSLAEVETSLAGLQRQKRLLLDEDPLSAQSLLITLSSPIREGEARRLSDQLSTSGREDAAAGGQTRGPEGGDGAGSESVHSTPPLRVKAEEDKDAAEDAGTSDLPRDALERTLQRAAAIVKQYCDRRLRIIRDTVVDDIHSETLSVAHATRTQRILAWAGEAADRKEQLGEHLHAMMQRYMDLSQTRAVQKQASMRLMHEELASTTERLRHDAAERLQRLTTEVSTKLSRTTESFEAIAREHTQHLQQKIAQTVAGDAAMTLAQQSELARRFETEDRVRRQLREAALATLQDQLAKMQAQGQRGSQTAFTQARESAAASTAGLCDPLLAQMLELKRLVESRVEEARRAEQQRGRQGWAVTPWAGIPGRGGEGGAGGAADEASLVMARQERESSLQALQLAMARTQDELCHHRHQLKDACERLHTGLADHLQALREKRLAQQSHQSAIDFTRAAWERDHRQNLKMELHLAVPAIMSDGFTDFTTGERDDADRTAMGAAASSWPSTTSATVETHAAPGDVALVAFLEFVWRTLAGRTARARELQSRRKKLSSTLQTEWAGLSAQLDVLRKLWTTLSTVMSELDVAHDSVAMQHVGVYKEQVENAVRSEEVARQRQELTQRHAALEAKSERYHAERAQVQKAHDEAKEQLQSLLEKQLHLAMEEQRRRVTALARQSTCAVLRDCTNVPAAARHVDHPSTTTTHGKPHHRERQQPADCSLFSPGTCTPPRPTTRTGGSVVDRGRAGSSPPRPLSSTGSPLSAAAAYHRRARPHDDDDGSLPIAMSTHRDERRQQQRRRRPPSSSTSTSAPEPRIAGMRAGDGRRGGRASKQPLSKKKGFNDSDEDLPVRSASPPPPLPHALAAPGAAAERDRSPSSTAPGGGYDRYRHLEPQRQHQPDGPDSSTVSVSSFYRSGTFVDLVTMLDSTTVSGIESSP